MSETGRLSVRWRRTGGAFVLLLALGTTAVAGEATAQAQQVQRESHSRQHANGPGCTLQSDLWAENQQTAMYQGQWWEVLQRDHAGGYPMQRDRAGFLPSLPATVPATGVQVANAQRDLELIRLQMDIPRTETGLVWDIRRTAWGAGLDPENLESPQMLATHDVYEAAVYLERAVVDEYTLPGSGLDDYHVAQGYLGWAWGAMKGLPCGDAATTPGSAFQPPRPAAPVPAPKPSVRTHRRGGTTRHATPARSVSAASVTVTAWVTPGSMAYNAYPTLYARTTSGATCTAMVVYSTGRSPVSFPRTVERAGSGGTVQWNWHEETRGSGGNATVRCSLGSRSAVASTSFSVSHP